MGTAEAQTCVQCGQTLSATARFCERCGTPSPTPASGPPTPHDQHALRVGEVLDGKWKLESKLGSGGMGAVFLAHDLSLDRKVAVKVLAGALCGDKEFTERFEREARMTARLEHPNIVPVYAVGRHYGRPFIVMKALEGMTLARMIRNRIPEKKGFTRDELLPIVKPLCSGLGFIHSKGYVHRDIKAGNVFVSSDGHVTLLDFGVLRDATAGRTITRTGALLGTPHYYSPEQAKAVREIDGRSDLYSVGVLVFECLALRPPFEGDPLSLMRAHISAPPPDVSQVVPGVPAAVGQVIVKAMAKKPADRFATAQKLYSALEQAWPAEAGAAVAGGAGAAAAVPQPAAPGDGPRTPPRTPSRRLGVAAAAQPSAAASEAPTPPSLEIPGRSSRWPLFAGAGAVALVLSAVATWALWPSSPDTSPGDQRGAGPLVPVAVAGTAEPSKPDPRPEPPKADPEPARPADPEVAQPAEAAPEPGAAEPEPAPMVFPKLAVDEPRAPARPKRARTGQLRITTTLNGEPYWASVKVDGKPKGETPLLLELPAGRHRVHVERSGLKPVNREVTIPGGGAPVVLGIELRK